MNRLVPQQLDCETSPKGPVAAQKAKVLEIFFFPHVATSDL